MEIITIPEKTLIKEELISYWKEILEYEDFSEDSNFFDLGGNSLLAMQFIQMVKNNMGVKLPIKVIFEQSTFKELTTLIKHIKDINKLN